LEKPPDRDLTKKIAFDFDFVSLLFPPCVLLLLEAKERKGSEQTNEASTAVSIAVAVAQAPVISARSVT
jgi:hypothetical protein